MAGHKATLYILLFISLALGAGETLQGIDATAVDSPVSVEIISDDQFSTDLDIHVDDFNIQPVDVETGRFDLVSIGLEPTISREGWPDLPFIARSVLVPPQSDIRLEIGDISYRIENGLEPVIAPRETDGQFVQVGEADQYREFEGFWPPQPVILGEPAILRGWRIMNFRCYPVQYNRATGEMKFNDRIEFRLVYEGIGQNIVADPERLRPSIYARRALEQLVENPPPSPARDDLLSGSYLYIAPNVNNVRETLAPLIEWRKRQGHRVSVEYVQDGVNVGTIGDLIEEYYESDDPVEFVTLVGDNDGAIRVTAATPNGDYGYTRLDGNDPLPDIAIGRMSCSSIAELERIVNKLVTYESDPYMDDTDWFLQGAVVAGYGGNGLSTVLVAKYVRRELLKLGFQEVRHWYHNADGNIGGNQPFLTGAMDWGISVLHYRAYMYMNNLDVAVIYNMSNRRGRWPAVLAISCATGHFVGRDAHTEAFLKSRGGGIGAIGTSTSGTRVQYNNIMAGGVWEAIYKKKLYAFGWGLNGGKYNLWQAYHGFDMTYMSFMDWNNLMGDAGTHIWTGIPVVLAVDHTREIEVGASRFSISVHDDENEDPVPDALVCLYKEGEIHMTTYTDDEGHAEFYIDPEALSAGTMMLTVTKHNHKAYLFDADVVEPENFLGISAWSIDDDNNGESSGDDDGIVNPGETIELEVTFTNFGENAPDGEVIFELESLSDMAEVLGDPAQFNEAPAEGESAAAVFIIQIDPACPDQTSLLLAGNISVDDMEWTSMAEIVVDAPKIEFVDIEYLGGDFDPGTVRRADITLRNMGHKRLDACTATLVLENDIVRALTPEAEYRPIGVDREANTDGGMFRLGAHPFTIPGIVLPVRLLVETEAGFTDETLFTITVGNKGAGDPLGPDDYGYICLDSGDEDWEYAPVYDWVEINPDVNENDFDGTDLRLRDNGDNQDESEAVDLPFEFQYYGEVFDEITICTNGWAAFGDQSELSDFRNRRIAQALGPNAQLCAWWDNLMVTNNGAVLTYYDREGSRFIIEWYNTQRLLNGGGGGARETFEIILYDPEVHPTVTGDGMILFQYKNVENENRPAHNDTPFCTIGISNLDDSDGIEYTYWNTYPPGAQRIENEMALLFITQSDFRTGVVHGTVTDASNGDPIQGAQILTTRSFWAETDEEGYYITDNILTGEDYAITAFGQGWNDSTLTGFDIAEDETLEVNFSLLHPEFQLSEEGFERRLAQEESEELEFTLSNQGNGTLTWRSEKHLLGDVDADPWTHRRAYPLVEIINDTYLVGLVYINGEFFITGANRAENDPQIYVVNRDGEFQRNFSQPGDNGNFGMKGLTWDGNLIWGSGGNNVYGFNTDGELQAEFRGPWAPNQHLAWDAERGLLWLCGTTTDIIGCDREGNQRVELDNYSLRIYGLAYYPDDHDDCTLYIYSYRDDMHKIHKMNPDIGDTIFVSEIFPPVEGSAGDAHITNTFDIYSWVMMTLTNSGEGDEIEIWQVEARKEWMDLDPEEGVLIADEVEDLTLTLDTRDMASALFEGEMIFSHNASGGETHLDITLDISPAEGGHVNRTLDFTAGWNLVSLNINPEIEDVVELTQPLVDAGLLRLMKDGMGRFYLPEEDFNNIPGWLSTDGYQMYMMEDSQLEVGGISLAEDEAIPLQTGWNMKAYYPRNPIDAIVALANIENQLIIAKDVNGNFYLPEFEFSNMGEMEEGQGYQFKVSEDVDLVYNLQERLAEVRPGTPAPVHFGRPAAKRQNMSVLLVGHEGLAGWEAAVFNEAGAITGAGRFDERGTCGIAVWGDSQSEDRLVMHHGDALQVRLWDGENELAAGIEPLVGKAQWGADEILAGNLAVQNAMPVEFGIQNAYPNPFNSEVRISYGIRDAGKVTLRIFDVSGRLAKSFTSEMIQPGFHHYTWHADSEPSGIYFIHLEHSGRNDIAKLMLIR